MSSMPKKLSPGMWLSAKYVCHVEEAVLLYKECLQAELEVHRAEAVRPEEERQTLTKKVLKRKACMPGYYRDKVNQQGFTEMKPK